MVPPAGYLARSSAAAVRAATRFRRHGHNVTPQPSPSTSESAATALAVAACVGAQWELPGAVERETGAILSLSGCGRGILTPPRRRAFWPDGGPSCTLPDRREAAVLQRRFPRSCAPRTFSASPSGLSTAVEARRHQSNKTK